MAQLDLRCPTCGQVDKVQKVSIIAEGDVVQHHSEYGNYTYPTNLANSLARPSEPKDSTAGGCGITLGILFLIMGVAGLADRNTAGTMLAFSVLSLGGGLLLSILAFFTNSRDKKKYKEMLDHWPKADERWTQLYYCHRDDVIFNPYDSERVSMPVSNMTNYLFGASGHPQQNLNREK